MDLTTPFANLAPANPGPAASLVLDATAYDLATRQSFFTALCVSLTFALVRRLPGACLSLMEQPVQEAAQCVGAMIFDTEDQVLLGQGREAAVAAWQLPQTEVAQGEGPLDAAFRVLEREFGIEDPDPLIQTCGWIEVDGLSVEAEKTVGFQQKWLAFRQTGNPDLGELLPDGLFGAWRWVPLHEVPALLAPYRTVSPADVMCLAKGEPLPAPNISEPAVAGLKLNWGRRR